MSQRSQTSPDKKDGEAERTEENKVEENKVEEKKEEDLCHEHSHKHMEDDDKNNSDSEDGIKDNMAGLRLKAKLHKRLS